MLKIDNVQQIGTVTAYGDDRRDNLFYLLPGAPRFRTDDQGRPVFRYLKYKQLRQDGDDFFGGLCAFDTCLSLTPQQVAECTARLQQRVNDAYQARGQQPPTVEIGPMTYTGGTVDLSISGANDKLVQAVRHAGAPSLYGENVASFFVELTREGATVFEQALQGQGGFVAALYKVKVWAQLPPITGHATWNASKFYDFVQTIDTEDNFWSEDSYEENIREVLTQNEVQDVKFTMVAIPGMPPDQQSALENELRANLNRQLEAAVERNMLKEIQAVDPDTKSLREDQDIEDIKRTVSKTQIASVSINLSETHTIEWPLNPQGALQNITTMTGPDGPIRWADYATEVDLDDPFFRTLEVPVSVNADFADLPLFSVEAKLTYPDNNTVQEFVFKSPDDVGRFRCFVANNNKKYRYSYTVNYKGESQSFQSDERETDDPRLTINIDDLGIWAVTVAPGDINFDQVKQAQIALRNEEVNPPIERQFTMTADAHDFKVREVTMLQRKRPFKFRVKYFMKDGKEFDGGWQDHDAPQLYINDPFAASRTFSLRAVGDLQNRIESITVDLDYTDAANGYSQARTMTLSAATPFFDWTFPVISEIGGRTVYTGTVMYKDGTSRDIPETEATRSTIQLGDLVSDRLRINIVPDLVDFEQVKLINVSLHYEDTANAIDQRQDFLFRKGDAAREWLVDLKDRAKKDYDWKARFFLQDGSDRNVSADDVTEQTLLLQLPTA